MKIQISLDDRSFEYDIYTLVIAFFQGSEVQVFDPPAPESDADLLVEVAVGKAPNESDPDKTAESGRMGRAYLLVREMAGIADGNDAAVRSDVTAMPDVPVEPGVTAKPDAAVRSDKAAEADACASSHEHPFCETRYFQDFALQERGRQKNILKRALYEVLRSYTGRDLPWGNLTGIRPVKLAMDLLKNGEPDPVKRLSELYFVSPGKADLALQIAKKESLLLGELKPEEHYSLYLGIPFCPSICLYCSFSSSPLKIWEKQVDSYLDALIREIGACRDCFPGKKLQTVYIGGGTPTTLTPQQSDRLLSALERNFPMEGLREFTVEAGRPDSISREKLQVLKEHGVSRISINPQTMNQKTLDLIGRHHTVEETEEAFALARSMGFDNINMDIIVGLPGEGLKEVEHTMKVLCGMEPDDITVHALALKRAARLSLHMDEYEKISFKASDEIMRCTEEACRSLSMSPYYLYRQKNMAGNFENTGYAKEGKEGIYNVLIMEEVQSILALGASGSTKIVEDDGRIWRIENVKDIRSYLERIDEMIGRKAPIGAVCRQARE